MANKRIDQLTAGVSLELTSLIEVCIDPAGTRLHRKFTLQQLFDFFSSIVGIKTFVTAENVREFTAYLNNAMYVRYNELADDGISVAYRYDSTSILDDNGLSVLKPNDIDIADPGRYLQITL